MGHLWMPIAAVVYQAAGAGVPEMEGTFSGAVEDVPNWSSIAVKNIRLRIGPSTKHFARAIKLNANDRPP